MQKYIHTLQSVGIVREMMRQRLLLIIFEMHRGHWWPSLTVAWVGGLLSLLLAEETL